MARGQTAALLLRATQTWAEASQTSWYLKCLLPFCPAAAEHQQLTRRTTGAATSSRNQRARCCGAREAQGRQRGLAPASGPPRAASEPFPAAATRRGFLGATTGWQRTAALVSCSGFRFDQLRLWRGASSRSDPVSPRLRTRGGRDSAPCPRAYLVRLRQELLHDVALADDAYRAHCGTESTGHCLVPGRGGPKAGRGGGVGAPAYPAGCGKQGRHGEPGKASRHECFAGCTRGAGTRADTPRIPPDSERQACSGAE